MKLNEFLNEEEFTSTSTEDIKKKIKEKGEWKKLDYSKNNPFKKEKEPTETKIEWGVKDLSYEVVVHFHKSLTSKEEEKVESIVKYWGAIPYVGELLGAVKFVNLKANIPIDLTKSSSDDIGAREPFKLLANWIKDGTKKRKDGSRAIEGIGFRPTLIQTDY